MVELYGGKHGKINKYNRMLRRLRNGCKVRPVPYDEPDIRDMAILIPFFNLTKSVRLIQNLLTVKHLLERANIPFYIGELAFNDAPFLLSPAANIHQFRSTSYMFYKENIVTVLEKRVPASFTKLCILDADVWFGDPAWYSTLSASLNHVQTCQPFQEAVWLDIDYTELQRQPCLLKEGHPGFAWGIQRSAFELPEWAIAGQGDAVFASAITHKELPPFLDYLKHVIRRKPLTSTHLDGMLYHMYHGPIDKRQYKSRHVLLTELLHRLGITIDEAIRQRVDGIFEWNPTYMDECNALMALYLYAREDDSI